MIELKYQTPPEWAETVMNDFDAFLSDHAAAEKKASGMAMSMLSHYPDRKSVVKAMTDLAIEELIHFKQVLKLITARGQQLGRDQKDPYIHELRALFRRGTDVFFLDRLLIAGVIEARGYERFSLIAHALEPGKEKELYWQIARSEEKHANLFVELALEYFDENTVYTRLEEILNAEAEICRKLPFRAALH
ncbi:tRNA-(ms[2]io[6]A)-hydroxylase [Thalassotalea agarivorans]|uniref:tRNA-(Ms[2]io[6]A)-hydroxylase n=1 Tax=Thalassotalea agarivorans TaxID=349064 RepID=A0A1I0EWR4_THASX|nr:tRNA-(ms[2]io[6]A)-hydroxylase [Thalassotalea agarivorans]SET49356.1 tRNA-(ms[2]io[6]A)-hydroxylase [Thalassotalea agarivorans]